MIPQTSSERQAGFGRRVGPTRPVYKPDGTDDTQGGPTGAPGRSPSDPMRNLIRIVPIIVTVMGVMFVTVRLINGGAGSSGFQCRPQTGGVFAIDWCRAARAAVEGGVRGMAGAAGARR